MATAKVVKVAAESTGERLKAEYAVASKSPHAAEAIAAAKPVIQQALQAAQAAAEEEKKVKFPTGGSLVSIFMSFGSEQREQTTRIAQEYLAKIKADEQAVDALLINTCPPT